MGHAHHHDHDHSGTASTTPAFAIGVALNAAFVVVEAAFGFWAGSLALLADAGHNLSDVLGLLLAWGASYLACQRPSRRRTYGLRRSSIMAALANALLLLAAVGAIVWEAIGRLIQPTPAAPVPVIVVAGIGVAVNTLTALLFLRGRHHDLNVRGAFLHMAADAAVSLGVVVAGIVIAFTGWQRVDPLLSLLIAGVIAWSTWDLLWQAVNLSLDAVPRGIDPAAVRAYLAALPGVSEVHDLHIWGLSTTESALTVHLIKPGAALDDDWLAAVSHELHDRFGIGHATIQVESGAGSQSCRLAPEDVV
ncbi:MAG TPA: cation diffusion facilitator family transporter [Pirellulaceae bacterium]|nr:cation diffusion facilitator family transporter [Pirellulaceae bacterium]